MACEVPCSTMLGWFSYSFKQSWIPYAIKRSIQMSNGPQAISGLWHLHRINCSNRSFSLHDILTWKFDAQCKWGSGMSLEAWNSFVCFIKNSLPLFYWITWNSLLDLSKEIKKLTNFLGEYRCGQTAWLNRMSIF
jgi:hypothetical protein